MKAEPSKAKTPKHWRVGDLAQLSGLTVRTLHHYEEIGLLPPASRTESGHRVYDADSVQRLYRVLALRSLGVALTEIRQIVGDAKACSSILRQHLARVEQEVEQLTALRDRLRRICRHPRAQAQTHELLGTIEQMARLQQHVDVRRRQPAPRSVKEQWRPLARELRACMKAGQAPSSGTAREVARRARALIREFAGDDPAIIEALNHVRTADPPSNLDGWTPELLRYLDDALRALGAEENARC